MATNGLKEDEKIIKQEREAIQSRLSEAKNQLKKLIEDRQSINDEISKLHDTIEQFEEMQAEIQGEMKENEQQLLQIEERIEQLQDDLELRNEILKEKAVIYQKTGTRISYLQVILGSKNFGDFINRIISLSRISQADDNFIEQTLLKQNELLEMQAEFLEKQEGLAAQLTELEVIYDVIQEEQEKSLQLLAEVKENEKEQEKLISKLVKEEKELGIKEKEIRRKIEEELKREEEQRKAREEEKNKQKVNRGKDTPNQLISDGEWETFIATAYTANCKGCSGITYTGINLHNNPNAKVVAVDPNLIPLGSKVEIKGYGTYLAADIGGAIKGRKIDIFVPNKATANRFGIKSVQIRILN